MVRIDGQARGTRVLVGHDARAQIELMKKLSDAAPGEPIILPSLDSDDYYEGSPGEKMRVEGPSSPTILCPEKTSQIRRYAKHVQDSQTVWYCERCYRLERPQAGRWREFVQFGVEWINEYHEATYMSNVAIDLLTHSVSRVDLVDWLDSLEIVTNPQRGLHYYTNETFEINDPLLGAQKQICGGGQYPEGCGFAIGVDRLLHSETYKSKTSIG